MIHHLKQAGAHLAAGELDENTSVQKDPEEERWQYPCLAAWLLSYAEVEWELGLPEAHTGLPDQTIVVELST